MEIANKIAFNSYLPWHFYFILLQLVLLAGYKLQSAVSWKRVFVQVFAPIGVLENRKDNFFQLLFLGLGLLNLSFSILLLGKQIFSSPYQLEEQPEFLFLLFFVAIWFVAYLFVYNLGFWLSQENKMFAMLKSSMEQLFLFYGLAGFGINLLLIFIPNEFQIIAQVLALAVLLLLIVRRYIVMVSQAIFQQVSFWYIILYLCTLEIMPLLCVMKLAL